MARQHREFQSQLDDAKKLWLYAQSVVSKHHALDASLAKAKFKFKHWEREAKASAGNIARAKAKMVEANQESKIERTSLLLELGVTKDEVPSLHSQASMDKEAMKEEYQKALEVIFSYGTGVVCSNTAYLEIIYRSQTEC